MRSLLARLAVLGAFAVTVSACGGSGATLPFAGPPNNAGGTAGTFQAGGNTTTLLRFIQGSPDYAKVDVCVDNLPFGVNFPSATYGAVAPVTDAIAGGITHTIAVYPALPAAQAGLECPTAPGPYFGTGAIKVTTLSTTASNTRNTIVLGGTAASGTLGLYVYQEPSFAIAPAGPEVISHNAAPAFTVGKTGVGFGICTTTVTPCAAATGLTGAQNVAAPKASSAGSSTANGSVQSGLAAVPAGFYDGAGVAAGTPVPITSIAAPNPVAGQPYVVQLYAIDAPAGGLNLVGYVEQTLGFGL